MSILDVQPAPPSRRARHWARRTHRVLGVSSLLFLVFISVSGIVLNHAEELGLSRSSAGTWILDIYDVPLPPASGATPNQRFDRDSASVSGSARPSFSVVDLLVFSWRLSYTLFQRCLPFFDRTFARWMSQFVRERGLARARATAQLAT